MTDYPLLEEPQVDVAVDEEVTDDEDEVTIHIPRYNVILWNDDEHTVEYVILMLGQIFGHTQERGYQIALDVDKNGKAIVETTTKERAELKKDMITSFGADPLVPSCVGSMSASIEPNE